MRTLVVITVFFLVLIAPVRAGDDVTVAETIIRSQADAFSRDDAAAAYSYAAPAIHQIFPGADNFMAMVRKGYAPVYRHKSFEFGKAEAFNGRVAVEVHIIDADGVPWDALYTLEEQADGSLKITACVLKSVGQSA